MIDVDCPLAIMLLLEHPRDPFELESYRVQKSTGVGTLIAAKQESIGLDD